MMLGIPGRYFLKHPVSTFVRLASDPLQVWLTAQDVHLAQLEYKRPRCRYDSDPNWERDLHACLGVPWPCTLASEFWALWSAVMSELEAQGIRPGPESFLSWNDGDAGFVRAIWCMIRHTRPEKVVETGVAHGVTSRFVLEALAKNRYGHLWSIDLPPIEAPWRRQVGMAIGGRYPDQWSYIEGSSRRRLPGLLSRLGRVDLFIHDSLHSERNVRFELDRAWHVASPTAAAVVDDVDANWGFRSFTQAVPDLRSLVCEAEPLHPDPRRFNQKGLFGIILKQAACTA
jgi:hypothetical protein